MRRYIAFAPFLVCISFLQNMRALRLFLLLAFSALTLLEVYGFTDETDRQALLEFKSQVSEDKRDLLSSWNNSLPLCSWTRVTCGRKHKRVTGLDLGGLELGGVVSPSIGNLSFLISLDLSNNFFGGTIPREVGNLFRLEILNMSSNSLGGDIPASLSNCSRLLTLDLHSNHLGQGVPSQLGSLTKLSLLDLRRNNLKGKLPASLGNLTSLGILVLGYNKIEGRVPDNIARLTHLFILQLSINKFSGDFPPAIYNLSSLEHLNLLDNGFSGSLRSDIGNLLPKLRELYMGLNYFTGAIPTTLANISNFQMLGMEFNRLTGSIPPSFGKVWNLQRLTLNGNSLGSYYFEDLEFLDALTNCTQLLHLDVSQNRLRGDLLTSIVNMSTSLNYLDLSDNSISGSIPSNIGNLKSLQTLRLENNVLTGILPTSLGMLSSLEGLNLNSNRISGEIPSSIGNISRLVNLYLFNNSFRGIVPPSLGNCRSLLHIWMASNRLTGTIPQEIMQIPQLVTLSVSDNSLTGSLPKEIGGLGHLIGLSVANNNLSGQLPQSLGNCLSMEQLYMQGNSFDGIIPDIHRLVSVKRLDFSNNNLFGSIPTYLANFSKLQYLNLSFNNLEGKVPTEGIFQNVTIVTVVGNKNLCGGIKALKLKPCPKQTLQARTKHSSHLKKVVIGVSVGMILLLLVFVASVSLCWFRKQNKSHANNPTPSTLGAFHEHISYGDLRNATDGFSPDNMIGSGSFGTVFKALLPGETKVVAVKVLNLQRKGAMKSFLAECESLKDIRHRNLVKLSTVCSSIDSQGNSFRALVYEFMPNGSLDVWLHPEEVEEIRRPSRRLTLFERLNILIDVASVLDYLHVHCHNPIAHCDLKPSNVLLDDDLIAHVSDFGLARLLDFSEDSSLNQLSSSGMRGTIGYAAPEYGMGGKPSIYGDMYSFGILLLEMFTGKRPTNELFKENFTLHNYTKSAMQDQVLDIIDESILQTSLRRGFDVVECVTLALEVGLRCCEESPTNRLPMSEALRELISIREKFFKTRRTTRL